MILSDALIIPISKLQTQQVIITTTTTLLIDQSFFFTYLLSEVKLKTETEIHRGAKTTQMVGSRDMPRAREDPTRERRAPEEAVRMRRAPPTDVV